MPILRFPSLLVAAILLAPAALVAQQPPGTAPPAAQTPASPPPAAAPAPEVELPDIDSANFFDVGFRGTGYADGSDEARYQRYRDLRNGVTLDVFRFAKDSPTRYYSASANHVGYRDQQYTAALNQYGKVKVSFEWNQIPLFFSESTLSLHTTASPGELRINDAIQSGVQNGTTTVAGSVGQAVPFDMRMKRSIADLRLTYSASRSIDVNFQLKSTQKTGSQPWAGGFGFSNAVELPVPVDTRTTEVATGIEWGNERATAKVGYDGSFFRNELDTLVWDSPLRITDSSSAPFQGRMALWPDSDLNTFSMMGTLRLPARSLATAYVSFGSMSQDADLIPFTINTALPVLALDRPSTEAEALVTAMNYTFTSRPIRNLALSARFRLYDFDNQTPIFKSPQYVAYDSSVKDYSHGGTSPLSFSRDAFDADASFTPFAFTAFRIGYSRETMDQTFRSEDSTAENTLRLSADTTVANWLTLRGVYEHAKRTGNGFDEQVLDDLEEITSVRRYDISDKTTDRMSAIVIAGLADAFSVNGSVSVGSAERPYEGLGLLNADSNTYSIGADYVPRDTVSFGTSYTFEKYSSLQKSRQASSGQEFDTSLDWTNDVTERADTFEMTLDLLKAIARTDIKFAYNYSHASSGYFYTLAANSPLAPVSQLPEVVNQLQRATVDVRYYLTSHIAIGGMYWYDDFNTDDFANDPATLNSISQPSFLMVGYTTRPYTAQTFVGRLTYVF